MVHHERTYWHVKINKSPLPFKIVSSKTEILCGTDITNELSDFFTDIGLKLDKKILESSLTFESYMKNVRSEMEKKPRAFFL